MREFEVVEFVLYNYDLGTRMRLFYGRDVQQRREFFFWKNNRHRSLRDEAPLLENTVI